MRPRIGISVKGRTDRIGQLDELIDVFREVEVKDQYGAISKGIEVIQNGLWADCEVRSVNEVEDSDSMVLYELLLIRVRYREDIDNGCSISRKGLIYNIVGIKPIGRREFIELRCIKRDAYEQQD